MAQKGQKFNNYSYQEKIKIIDEYYNVGGSTYSLAKKYNISKSTIRNWIELYKKNRSYRTFFRLKRFINV